MAMLRYSKRSPDTPFSPRARNKGNEKGRARRALKPRVYRTMDDVSNTRTTVYARLRGDESSGRRLFQDKSFSVDDGEDVFCGGCLPKPVRTFSRTGRMLGKRRRISAGPGSLAYNFSPREKG